jgi:hypothetical protein
MVHTLPPGTVFYFGGHPVELVHAAEVLVHGVPGQSEPDDEASPVEAAYRRARAGAPSARSTVQGKTPEVAS